LCFGRPGHRHGDVRVRALKDLKERGAEIAYVGTGGDPAHQPARSAYEAGGFDKTIPGAHLFKLL
jgi:hypothetical protein